MKIREPFQISEFSDNFLEIPAVGSPGNRRKPFDSSYLARVSDGRCAGIA